MKKSIVQNAIISIIIGLSLYYTITIGTFLMIILVSLTFLVLTVTRNTQIMTERKEEPNVFSSSNQDDILSDLSSLVPKEKEVETK
tara:strand:+ start:204 stop:461 length:258 start_codon:yes stop_codon:yes gene_type:complete